MPQYFIGNCLRGYVTFEAEDDDQAWTAGKLIIDTLAPSNGGRPTLAALAVSGEHRMPGSHLQL